MLFYHKTSVGVAQSSTTSPNYISASNGRAPVLLVDSKGSAAPDNLKSSLQTMHAVLRLHPNESRRTKLILMERNCKTFMHRLRLSGCDKKFANVSGYCGLRQCARSDATNENDNWETGMSCSAVLFGETFKPKQECARNSFALEI